ncbi:MAG: hypothetical protein ACFFDN_41855, partial [Candidatus Hodarchaeota archaeon]
MKEPTLNLIEEKLKSKGIKEYEIFLLEQNIFENIYLKAEIENERNVNAYDYTIRILNQKRDKTGIGYVKGNSLNPKEIEKNIESCVALSKSILDSKYEFPTKHKIPEVITADSSVLKDPIGTKKDYSEELISEIQNQKGVSPTFGRFRVHIDNQYL